MRKDSDRMWAFALSVERFYYNNNVDYTGKWCAWIEREHFIRLPIREGSECRKWTRFFWMVRFDSSGNDDVGGFLPFFFGSFDMKTDEHRFCSLIRFFPSACFITYLAHAHMQANKKKLLLRPISANVNAKQLINWKVLICSSRGLQRTHIISFHFIFFSLVCLGLSPWIRWLPHKRMGNNDHSSNNSVNLNEKELFNRRMNHASHILRCDCLSTRLTRGGGRKAMDEDGKSMWLLWMITVLIRIYAKCMIIFRRERILVSPLGPAQLQPVNPRHPLTIIVMSLTSAHNAFVECGNLLYRFFFWLLFLSILVDQCKNSKQMLW